MEPTTEQLAELRKLRLEGLKAGAAAPQQAPTPLQEVAKVFVEDKTAGSVKRYQLEVELTKETEELGALAAKVVTSLKAEVLPGAEAAPKAEKVVDELVGKLEPFARDQGRQQAELALTSTKASITALQTGNTPEDDEVMILLRARQLRQEGALEKLEKKTPSVARRRNALVTARQDFVDAQSERADVVARGTGNSIERACERAETLQKLEQTVERLKEAADQAVLELTKQRDLKENGWRDHAKAVVDLIDQKIVELDEGTITLDSDTEEEVATTTERERDESISVAAKLKQQIAQLQEAVRLAEETEKAPAVPTADPMRDLHLDFKADPQLLPVLSGNPSAEQAKQLGCLQALFTAVPWGAPLPTVDFHNLGAHPAFIHGLLGDAMWVDCWKERQGEVTTDHMVPFKIMNILKWLVERDTKSLEEAQLEAGRDRYTAICEAAAQRAKRDGPYSQA